MLKVKLVEHTPNAEKIIASAAKLCYSNANVDDLMDGLDEKAVDKFLNKLIDIGHESPIEHVNFTFAVEGVSRSLTHQLVRHRIASYSQQSQRYVKLNQFDYVVPPAIADNESAKNLFLNHMISSQMVYDSIVKKLQDSYTKDYMEQNELTILPKGKAGEFEKKAIEDARYVFPNACASKVMFTMNARTLLNFFKHRCCNRAQWEIRELANKMLELCKEVGPIIFARAGAGCTYGNCPEGIMSCGNPIKGGN